MTYEVLFFPQKRKFNALFLLLYPVFLSSVQTGQKDKKKMEGNKNNRHWISVFQVFFLSQKRDSLLFFLFSLLSVLSDFRQCKFVDLAKLLVTW